MNELSQSVQLQSCPPPPPILERLITHSFTLSLRQIRGLRLEICAIVCYPLEFIISSKVMNLLRSILN